MRCPVLCLTLLGLTIALQHERVLFDLLKWKHLKVVYVFHCFDQQYGQIPPLQSVRKNRPESMSFLNVATFSEVKFVASLQSLHVSVGFMGDMACEGLEGVLQALSVRGFFNGARYSWFLAGLSTLEHNRMVLEKLNVTVSSSVLLTLPMGTGNETNVAILDVCGRWMSNGWDLSLLQIGRWSPNTGLTIWDKRSTYERRQNLNGMQLKGMAKTIEGSVEHGELQSIRSYGLRLWNVLSTLHNLSINENLLKGDNNQTFDFLINPVEINQEDISKLDYTAAVHNTQTVLLFLHPNLDRTRNLFLRPFEARSWLGIGVLFLVFLLLLYNILHHLERKVQQVRENGILVLMLGIMCQQGFIESYRSYASRITLFALLIFSVLIYQFYLTHIVSFLLVVPPKTIRTLQQLVEHGFAVALENGPENVDFLNTTDDQHLMMLVEKQQARTGSLYYDVAEGMKLIQTGKIAFLCDVSRAYQIIQAHFTDEQRCALQEIPLVSKRSSHLALSKDNPLSELFRVTALRITGNGMMPYERKLCYADKPRCAEIEVKMPEVNLDQVSSVLLMLLCAVVGSVAVLLLELTVSRVIRRTRRH